MIARTLARLTDTPKFERGMQAFDVHYRTPEGDNQTGVLVYKPHDVGTQIREALFTHFPNATDYSFRQFDYMAWQFRLLTTEAITVINLRETYGENFIDEAEI